MMMWCYAVLWCTCSCYLKWIFAAEEKSFYVKEYGYKKWYIWTVLRQKLQLVRNFAPNSRKHHQMAFNEKLCIIAKKYIRARQPQVAYQKKLCINLEMLFCTILSNQSGLQTTKLSLLKGKWWYDGQSNKKQNFYLMRKPIFCFSSFFLTLSTCKTLRWNKWANVARHGT